MSGDGTRKRALIATVLILLCAIIPTAYSGNYICIGICDQPITEIPGNLPPILEPLQDQEVLENSLLTFYVNASDPNGNIAYFSAFIPEGASVSLAGSNLSFEWRPDFSQFGVYPANFSVTDTDGLTDYQNITITVINVNRPPIFTHADDREVNENNILSFNVGVVDLDDDPVSIANVTPIPRGASFTSDGTFIWVPDYQQAGVYSLNLSASDGEATVYAPFTIQVMNVNRLPVLTNPGNWEVKENTTLSFTLSATDPDNEPLLYSTVAPLPSGASLNPLNGDFTWTPTFNQNGLYSVNFSVSDGIDIVYAPITITVSNVNRPPDLINPGEKSIAENLTLNFTLSANDPDGDRLTFGNSSIPFGARLNASTGDFTWTPTFNQHGVYPVNFSVSDGVLIDYEIINITVTDKNAPPTLTPIGNQYLNEGLSLIISVNATDPDKDLLNYCAGPLPDRATFNTTTGIFSWIPSYTQLGVYYVNFTVNDASGLSDYENVTITVIEPIQTQNSSINYAPVFNPISDQTVAETYDLIFVVTAFDFNNSDLIYSADVIPLGASFDPITRVFLWTPVYSSSGIYWARFEVSDGYITDSITIPITVIDQPMPSHDCE